ncbi:hypothetical protein KAR91_54820 [Candidatus Pacearchaeota archaeon]|nr:hypothetical protein [Candidatus Pacearchaeota archaeon]
MNQKKLEIKLATVIEEYAKHVMANHECRVGKDEYLLQLDDEDTITLNVDGEDRTFKFDVKVREFVL